MREPSGSKRPARSRTRPLAQRGLGSRLRGNDVVGGGADVVGWHGVGDGAGMAACAESRIISPRHSRPCGNLVAPSDRLDHGRDRLHSADWVPACAGMTWWEVGPTWLGGMELAMGQEWQPALNPE